MVANCWRPKFAKKGCPDFGPYAAGRKAELAGSLIIWHVSCVMIITLSKVDEYNGKA